MAIWEQVAVVFVVVVVVVVLEKTVALLELVVAAALPPHHSTLDHCHLLGLLRLDALLFPQLVALFHFLVIVLYLVVPVSRLVALFLHLAYCAEPHISHRDRSHAVAPRCSRPR